MEFRIGVNLGDVIVNGENLFGDGVNIAARLELPNHAEFALPVRSATRSKAS
jgi:class 3 adenylate cyclase